MSEIGHEAGVGPTGHRSDGAPSWDGLASVWVSWAGVQASLLGVYLGAHGFLVAATSLLLVEFIKDPRPVFGAACLVGCGLGCLLAIAMRAAWARTVVCTLFLEAELRRLEGAAGGPFHRWQQLCHEGSVSPRDGFLRSLPDARPFSDWRWFVRRNAVPRATLLPPLLIVLYAVIAGAAVLRNFDAAPPQPAITMPSPAWQGTPAGSPTPFGG